MSNDTTQTAEQKTKAAYYRARDLRGVDIDNARVLSDALTDLLCTTDLVGGLTVEIEKKVDRKTDDLIELVRAAKVAFDLAVCELAHHACEVLETQAPRSREAA